MTNDKEKRIIRSFNLKVAFQLCVSIQMVASLFIMLMYIRLIIVNFDVICSSILLFSTCVNMIFCLYSLISGYAVNRKRLCYCFIIVCTYVTVQLFVLVSVTVLYCKQIGWTVHDSTSILCIASATVFTILQVIFFIIVCNTYPVYVKEVVTNNSVQFSPRLYT